MDNKLYSKWESTFLHTIINENILAFSILSMEGEVVYANQPFHKIAPNFHKKKLINPTFEKLATLQPDKNNLIFNNHLTIGDIDSNMNTSIQAFIFKKDNQFLLIENKDSGLLLSQNKNLTELTRENINLQRQLIKEKKNLEVTLKELEKLNVELNKELQSKDKFFSILAHDLSSPFNNILGFSEILYDNIDTLDAQKIKDISAVLFKTSKQTHDLLKNLLDWGILQRKKHAFKPKLLLLKNIIDDTILIKEENAAQKNITLTLHFNEQLKVYADPNMLATIIRNLVSNAIKFTPQNGKIVIKANYLNDNTQISVHDNGVGIPEDKLDKMFDEDFESTPGTNNEKGTGLGLTICKEFIELHDGSIWVESKLNKGTTMHFLLPLKSR